MASWKVNFVIAITASTQDIQNIVHASLLSLLE